MSQAVLVLLVMCKSPIYAHTHTHTHTHTHAHLQYGGEAHKYADIHSVAHNESTEDYVNNSMLDSKKDN